MSTNRTFTMIKPDAVENNHIGGIIEMIQKDGFKIKAMKMTRMSEDLAKSAEIEVQNITNIYIKKAEDIIDAKEKDIMTI